MSVQASVFDLLGGLPFFEELVDRFYDKVAADPDLLAVYPNPEDLEAARRRLALFVAQYWGGPSLYSAERGHPRLRMRHFPFAIGAVEHDRWLLHMRDAVEEMAPQSEIKEMLVDHFTRAAAMVRNR